MSKIIIVRPSPDIGDPAPIPPETLAVLRLARRSRITLQHATLVVGLAGLGPQPREVRP